VEVDLAQFETAILNIAVNARDAMPEGGTLTIATANEGDPGERMVRVAITDSGLGMPQRVLERAFEPFFTTKEVGKGTGLGLSQIHGFAAQAGGRAEIRSSEGAGTTVSILLPCSEKALSDSVEVQSEAALPPGTRVLLVEDNEHVRDFATSLLEDLGCSVEPVPTAAEALDRLGELAVDLVLSDVVLPGMSGVELARRLREVKPDLPVLLTTGYSHELVQNRGHFAVLPKPYNATELREAMAALVAQVREARAA
jgi:CheY-like chemotaxis protein